MLQYDVGQWRALPWWQQRAYREGMVWELSRGGLSPHPAYAQGDDEGGGSAKGTSQQYTAYTSMADRAADGITVIS